MAADTLSIVVLPTAQPTNNPVPTGGVVNPITSAATTARNQSPCLKPNLREILRAVSIASFFNPS